MNKKLVEEESKSKMISSSILISGLEKISKKKITLPPSIMTYFFNIKSLSGLSPTTNSQNTFKKPLIFGKGIFYDRLGEDLIFIGLAYQRIFLSKCSSAELHKILKKTKPWWNCSIKDIEKSIHQLQSKSILKSENNLLLFEPLTNSKDINSFLNSIYDHLTPNASISLEEIEKYSAFDTEKTTKMLEILSKEKILLLDKVNRNVYFPGLENYET